MKKSLLLITALFGACLSVNAQSAITINSTDVVGPGYTLLVAEDTVNTYNAGSAGASQTWNFSTLAEHNSWTTSFSDPTGLPGASSYPSANLALTSDDPEDDSSYIFIRKLPTIIEVLGLSTIEPNGDTNITNFPIDILTFPSTIGTTFTSSSWGIVLYEDTVNFDPDGPGPHPIVDSIKIIRATSTVSEIDAWGTLITPLGSFDVLRQDKNEAKTDSVFMKTNGTWKLISPELSIAFGNMDSVDVQTSYTMDWWSNDPAVGFPLVTFKYNNGTGDNDGGVEWLKANPTIGIYENLIKAELSIYPNPSSGAFTVHYKADNSSATVSVYDNLGSLLVSESITDQLALDLADAATGIYLVRIEDGAQVLSKKIWVK
ncbi:MAG TPA: T9SS type A sorting domain-containing protein [Flavobacteriales bacterium]|nr:T9SS type A sorting domain-containing protein [Flavobacteriales bacterium]